MKNETKVTAVEWLIKELEEHHVFHDIKNTVAYHQAKVLEKQQIIEAYSSDRFPCSEEDAKQYYTETYKP
jgi:hypothetical protein